MNADDGEVFESVKCSDYDRFDYKSMIYPADKQFIEQCLVAYASRTQMISVAQESPFDSGDAGVPPAMFDGEIDDEGWVKWKMLPSTVTEDDVAEIEKILPGRFPPLFRAFLTTRFVMSLESREVRLPALPDDRPLEDLRQHLSAWSALIPAGFIAFAEDGNDAGPLCFDFNHRLADGDCPVVLFDHDDLITIGEPACGHRETLLPKAKPAFSSFRDLFQKVCRQA